ncbi:MAG: MBL fold metallo-hydrolase [Chloroflexota bacterium]
MRITKHNDNLIQLTKFGVMNCYLVRETDGFTLVDAAVANCSEAILAAAEAEGLPIKRIVLTHAHVDHVGSLDELSNKLSDAEILLSERTEQFIHGDIQLIAGEPTSKIRGGFTKCTTKATRHLEPETMVGSLKVIAAPGHSPDHMVYMDTRDGTLIAGDAFQTLGGIAVSGTFKFLFPLPAFATWHKPTALETAKKLQALEPSRLAVGHGPVLQKPLSDMDQAIRQAS